MQLQRWQSVFLLLTFGLMACFTFMSLGQVSGMTATGTEILNFTTLGFTYEGEPTGNAPGGYFLHTWILFILSLAATAIPFFNIFLFNRHSLQRRLCLVEIIFIIAAISFGCWYSIDVVDGKSVSYSSVVTAPFIALVAQIVAWRMILSDHKKLREANSARLR